MERVDAGEDTLFECRVVVVVVKEEGGERAGGPCVLSGGSRDSQYSGKGEAVMTISS